MNPYNGVLVIFHCSENTGYAIETLEDRFYKVAKILAGDNIHFSFTNLSSAQRQKDLSNTLAILRFDPATNDIKQLREISQYIYEHKIDCVIGFDQQPGRRYYKYIRKAGVKNIVSYWGAAISSRNTGIKLFLKRLEMRLRRYSPDHYFFESKAMQDFAIFGRGISRSKTSITHLGVDTRIYKPNSEQAFYPYITFRIPKHRKILFYSGHMEPRKGVKVLIDTAIELADIRNINNFHILVLGNKDGQEIPFKKMLVATKAKDHVTFGGYRDDIPSILPDCYLGIIPSTGWDSFTMSSLEMASAGLPLLVSDLQGLRETISSGETGLLFKPGNHVELANKIEMLIADNSLHSSMSTKSRERICKYFTIKNQIDSLTKTIKALNI